RQALALAAFTFALVLPVTAYVMLTFRATSAADFAQAQDILANFRIPHHCRVDLWLDPVAGLQIGWIVLGLALARGTRLFVVLTVPFLLAVLLTLAQVITGSDTLALLFPWRVSAVLLPIATTVILSRLIAAIPRLDGPHVRGIAIGVVGICVAGGVW